MAKRMKNKERVEAKLLRDRTLLVEKAMEEGFATKKDIAKATGLKMWDIGNLFAKDRELYAKFCVRRKTIVDMASDNIYNIIQDADHPQNFQASKWALTNFKSDLDDALDAKDTEGIIEIEGGASSASPVVIKFGKSKQSNDEEN